MADHLVVGQIEAMAETIGLKIAPEHRDGVTLNFVRIAAMASLVMEYPLPDESEIAPIFVP